MAPCATTPWQAPCTSSTSSESSPTATGTRPLCGNGTSDCGPFNMTDHMADWIHYTQAIAASWHIKTAIAAVAAWFSTEPALLYMIVIMWCADLAFGLGEAFKHGKFSGRILKRGVIKIPAYCLYIGLVAAIDASIEIAFHMALPLLEAFLAYMVAQEAISIMGHMIRLGLPVPAIVRKILLHGKNKVEQKIDVMLDVTDEAKKD